MARKKPPPKNRDPRWRSGAEPAPGDLKLVQAFVDTAAHGGAGDELASPRALADWLRRWELPGAGDELDAADLERARAARAGLAAMVADSALRPGFGGLRSRLPAVGS